MTNRPLPLTEAALRRALVELAGEPDALALMTDIVRAVDGMSQVRRRPWDVPAWGRGALLLAAVLATLGIGAAVALSQPQPDPQPTPSVPALLPDVITVAEFAEPFRYQIPEGETDELTALGGDPTGAPSPLHGLDRGPGNLTLFLVSGIIHTCELEQVVEPSAQPGRRNSEIGTDPVQFLERLRDQVGVGIGPILPTTLGNLPAVEAEIGPSGRSTCYPQLHVDRLGLGASAVEPELRGPAKLIVARTGSTTIGVLIEAADEAAYDEWLPIAEAYVYGFDFYAAGR